MLPGLPAAPTLLLSAAGKRAVTVGCAAAVAGAVAAAPLRAAGGAAEPVACIETAAAGAGCAALVLTGSSSSWLLEAQPTSVHVSKLYMTTCLFLVMT
jgi:hypothetical protein